MTILLRYLLPPIAALLFAPLFVGIINRIKAFFAGKKGPILIQTYLDMLRLFRKGNVYSKSTSWIFRIAPIIIFSCTLATTMFVPIIPIDGFSGIRGDLILLIYLLGIARFFLILSALDTGSAFEGMGASREAFFSALAEPVVFVCLLNIMHSHHVSTLSAALAAGLATDSIVVLLAILPFFIVLLAENSRIPFDDPNTHLELTMIHEVMILDNSGSDLALLEYAASIKIWLFAMIIARILMPVPSSTPILQITVLAGIMIAIAVVVGIVESTMARVRMLKVPQLLLGSGVIALLGFFLNVTGFLPW